MASSLDVVGPITRSVEDAAEVLQVIAGKDNKDASTLDAPVPECSELLKTSLKGKKYGIPKEYFGLGLDSQVKKVFDQAIKTFEDIGGEYYRY
jgi:aspartyl-tRNA(Asn)/glutamyl-tRNA(Gln) amidotransferase subunit A